MVVAYAGNDIVDSVVGCSYVEDSSQSAPRVNSIASTVDSASAISNAINIRLN